MKLFASLSIAAALLLFGSIGANAGTLTIDSGQPTFTPSGAFQGNSITAQVTNGNHLQIFGSTTILVTPGESATISVTGTFAANTGDLVSFFYNFGINLSSVTPVTFTLQATANTQAGPVMVSDSGVVQPGNHQYSDMGQSPSAPFPLSGTYSASLTFNFGNATSPNKIPGIVGGTESLALTIPQGGLDFQLAPNAIPEPSTFASVGLGLGAALLLARRRRLA
jgi:hypothetical protein